MQGDFYTWSQTTQGKQALQWQLDLYGQHVCDVFGYHAVQLALPQGVAFPALQTNRIVHQTLLSANVVTDVVPSPEQDLVHCDWTALPLQNDSLDLLLCPHTLERSEDPHATLREIQRVLRPQGVVILSGLQWQSPWVCRAQLQRPWRGWRSAPQGGFVPEQSKGLRWGRLRDWLRLLHLELCSVAFFGHTLLSPNPEPYRVAAWGERLGARLWPSWAAVYFAVAIKRVHGVRLLEPQWSPAKPMRARAVPVRRLPQQPPL